jgi:glycosyltransferase involved in cell wall biosynthesis
MKRAVYDKIGGLDERFGLGLFDDDDLAERARLAGFELAVAHDLFVHHFGSRTFLGNGIDIDKELEENARRFVAKWELAGGDNGRQVVALRPWKQPEGGVENGVSARPCATPGGRGSVRAGGGHRGSDGASPSQDCANASGEIPAIVRVAWEGDFEALHSLATVNRAMCRGLIDRGHDVRLIAAQPGSVIEPDECVEPDVRLRQRRLAIAGTCAARDALFAFDAQVHVRHCWPPVIEPPASGKCVLMQPWEFGSLPKAWIPMLRQVDEVWAYSRYVRDCYLEAGVPRDKTHVVPLGIAPEVFRPGLEPLPLQAGPEIRLLFVGGTIHRKGIDVLLAAFARAFRPGDGVGLVIKEMGAKSFYRGQTAEAEIAALRERGYAVEYIDRMLSETEMAALYCACDALVQPFRGEGFGLPIVEAMACGLPVIITGAGPALDYASDKTAYFIPAERRLIADGTVGGMETIGQPWLFEPDGDALVDLMRRVVSDREGAKAVGLAASDHIREHFTWARTVEAVEQGLRLLTPGPMRTLTRSASEDLSPPSAQSGGPLTRGASEGLDRPHATSSGPLTRSVSTDLYPPSAQSSTTPTRSASEGLQTTRVRPEHPQPGGDLREPGHWPGTLADASGWYGDPASVVASGQRRAKISLTMIVKNEEENLPRCLASVEGVFDEIIVVDTGSTDRTKEIAREFGAKVFDFEWIDSFAAARNEALSHATGDYAFWLDADDEVEPAERVKLVALLAGLKRPLNGGMASAMLPVTPPLTRPAGDLSPRRGEDQQASHGTVSSPGEAAAPLTRPAGDLSPAGRGDIHSPATVSAPLARPAGDLSPAGRGDNQWRASHAVPALGKGSALGAGLLTVPAVRPLVSSPGNGRQPLDDGAGAYVVRCACAPSPDGKKGATVVDHIRLFPIRPGVRWAHRVHDLLWFRKGIVNRHRGESSEAERCWRLIFTLARPDQFRSVDPGIYGHLTRRNLAALAAERGDCAEVQRL